MQGTFEVDGEKGEAKRSRLDAVANNAPWRNLLPANDKATLERMRDHRDREAKYTALTPEQQKQVPRVSPYPETPDGVFPGTPCYRVAVGGRYVYVFVLDPASVGYPEDWDGEYRLQSGSYWIVPHFIYRDAKSVEERKTQWKQEYDHRAAAGEEPPSKTDYTRESDGSNDEHQSYYAPGSNNPNTSAPGIADPLFSEPFNENPDYDVHRRVVPYPYEQNRSEYPQRPNPTLVKIDGPDVQGKTHHDPHASLLETIPPHNTGRAGADWIERSEDNWEVGADWLRTSCERAEELDYLFAQSMQGLRGTNISAVWVCTDPEYDVTDRSQVLSQFVKMYMDKFYTHVSVTGSTDVEEVVHEALRLHEEFCKGWVHRHHRTLSAEVTAASEALVGLFFDELKGMFPAGVQPTRTHISRFLRRHPDYRGEFAYCLYHYMTSLEHMRGNRNPSYKAMNNERAAQLTSMRKMGAMLFEGVNRQHLRGLLMGCGSDAHLLFDLHYIDWHYIAAQMPQHHKEFNGYANSFNLYRTRVGGRANAFPPWQQMRMVR